MTDRDELCRCLNNAAWGYLFLNFDFKINTVTLLHRFVGFLLLLSAVKGGLSEVRRDLKLLRPLCVVLALWSGIDWLLSWWGGDVEGHVLFLDLLITAAALYFHFQFLTDMAALAEQYQPEGGGLDRRLLKQRTIYVLLVTAISLTGDLFRIVHWPLLMMTGGTLAVIACVDTLFIMADLFRLRNCVRNVPEAE